jgi:hypothetical protein
MQNITFFQRITIYLILYPWIKYIITFILPPFIPKICLDFVTDFYDLIRNGAWLKDTVILEEKAVFYQLFSQDVYYDRLKAVIKDINADDS